MVALGTVATIPLVMNPAAADVYRMPKELWLRGGAILLIAIALVEWIIHSRLAFSFRPHSAVRLTAGAVAWTVVSTVTSQQQTISVVSLAWVLSCAILFLAALETAQRRSIHALWAVMIPASIGAVTCLRQHDVLRWGGIFGIPNDAATYLAITAVAAASAALVTRGRTRWVFAAASLLMIAGIFATRTLGAVAAVAAGLAAVFLLALPRYRVIAAAGAAILVIVALVGYGPARERLMANVDAARTGNLDTALSGRATAFLAAARMTAQHPLVGVGPGCFGREYFVYKVALEDEYPRLAKYSSSGYNFGEVHNDHLQTLAQTGLPGYALAIFALGYLGRRSFRARTEDPRAELSRVMALPLALTFAVLGLTSFPLALAACTATFLFLAAVVTAWDSREVADAA
jgi:putative inorganic carbon (HCO3(-)) transporter